MLQTDKMNMNFTADAVSEKKNSSKELNSLPRCDRFSSTL